MVVERELKFGAGWATAGLRWGELELVRDDAAVTEFMAKGPRKSEKALEGWILEAFPPAESGDWAAAPRLLVRRSSSEAFHSSGELDELVRAGLIGASVEHAGEDYREWAVGQGLSLVERAPQQEQAPELYEACENLKRYPANVVSGALGDAIREAFRLIPTVREEPRGPGQRVSGLPAATVDEINAVLADRSPVAEERARKLERAFERFTQKRINFHPEGLLVDDGRQRLPFGHQGGGEQAVLGLVKQILEAPAILAIEEPESHLHPCLTRDLFDLFKEVAGTPQILVSTHSPMMMDKKARSNNWLCRVTEDGLSVVEQIVEEDDLRLALAELGSVPSDAYLKDVVLFVEGGTEKEVAFPIWAAGLGRPFPDNVGIVSLGGMNKLLDNLRIWLNLMEHSPARFQVALDANAGLVKERVVKELKIRPGSIRLMKWRCLEDTYPAEILLPALAQLFKVSVEEAQLPKVDRAAFIAQEVQKGGGARAHWKMELARAVASQMTAKQVPKGFANLLDTLDKLSP